MRKVLVTITIISFAFINVFINTSYAAEPSVSAQSAVVMDVSSGRVLLSKNANQKRSMASTTKIMTALVALEKGNLNDIIKTSRKSAYVEGSSIWLEEGEQIRLEDALYGLMLNSGNDAAIAIAEHVGGSVEKFADLMNEKAREIGADNTRFTNPHGLDQDGHYTTAYDLALITSYAMKNSKFAEIVKTKEKKIPWEGHEWDRSLRNHNKLLWQYPYADGVKTGFTKKTGRCLVSSATKDGWKLVTVTLNASNDWNDHKNMFEYAFSTFKPQIVLDKDQFAKSVAVKSGKKGKVTLVSEREVSIPLIQGEENKIRLEYTVPKFLEAPVSQVTSVGRIDMYVDNQRVGSVPLKPSEYVEKRDTLAEFNKIIKNWFMIFNAPDAPIR